MAKSIYMKRGRTVLLTLELQDCKLSLDFLRRVRVARVTTGAAMETPVPVIASQVTATVMQPSAPKARLRSKRCR